MKRFWLSTFTACVALGLTSTTLQNTVARGPFRLSADISRFRGGDDSTLLVEVHYSVGQAGLTYRPDSAGWSGAADLTLFVRTKDSLIFGDRWLVPHVLTDTAQLGTGMNLVGVYPVQLRRGEYLVSLIGRDRFGAGRVDSVVLRVPIVPASTNRLALSDIEFAATIRQGSDQGPFIKNTLEVIPNVGGLYGEDQTGFYYLEAYNLLLGTDRSDYRVKTSIFDAVGKELLSRVRPRKRSGESAVLVDQFAVANLKSGTYALVVTLLDTSGTSLVQSGRKFFVYNPTLGVDSSLMSGNVAIPLAVYASMGEEELDQDFRWSRFECMEAEKAQFEQLKGADAKRKFLSDFWRRRSPGARDEYMARVTYVNSAFSSMRREGYRTDRGRVYIVYGAPDDYDRHPNEPDTRPYEIWSYNSIQGGVIFVFVQRNQGGDFELVHSTHRNELHDEDWQRYAVQR